jgi:hypothetical protein
MKNEGALRMRFLRHVGIYRSDVSFLLFTPGACPAFRSGRCQGIGHTGKNMPCPSSAMSSGRLFLDQVARQHCLSPLRRQGHHKTLDQRIETNYHRTERCGLFGCLTLGVHPILQAGRHPHRHFRGLLKLHTRYGLQGCSPTIRGLYREAPP